MLRKIHIIPFFKQVQVDKSLMKLPGVLPDTQFFR